MTSHDDRVVRPALETDVLVVGASLAGCATAIHLRGLGHRVTVVDKRSLTDDHYKQLCSHFVQPHAVPLLDALGLGHLRGREHGVATKAVFVTSGGVIDPPGTGYDPDRPDSYALNLERRVVDPQVRARAREVGAELLDETGVDEVRQGGDGWDVTLRQGGARRQVRARLVVAADGRRSRVAGLLGNEAEVRPNQRAAVFAYFRGIDAPAGDRSVFVRTEGDLACLYPLVDGRTALVLFAEHERVQDWRGEERARELVRYFARLDAVPDMSGAVLDSPVLGFTDYPNQVRSTVAGGVPFVGDAALSLDPMSGTGCGFALLSADLLRRAFEGRSLGPDDVTAALADYAAGHAAEIRPHVDGICADSLVGRNQESERRMFEAVCADDDLARLYLDVTGRLARPARFQRALLTHLMAGRSRAASLASA